MNFFQKCNPVYLHKLLKEKEVELTEKDTIIQNLTYEYKLPTDDEIKCGYYIPSDNIIRLLDGDRISSKERKMALDIRVMIQLVEGMELELKRYRGSNLENTLKQLNNASKQLDNVSKQLDQATDRIAELNYKLEQSEENSVFLAEEINMLRNELARRDRLNEKLWVAIFGYGRDEMTILNKSFWGKDLVSVDLPGAEHDNNNA